MHSLNQHLELEVRVTHKGTIRVYLLYLTGTNLFTYKSVTYVDLYVEYLRDLKMVNEFSWGDGSLGPLVYKVEQGLLI